jgi:aminopeptidase 2
MKDKAVTTLDGNGRNAAPVVGRTVIAWSALILAFALTLYSLDPATLVAVYQRRPFPFPFLTLPFPAMVSPAAPDAFLDRQILPANVRPSHYSLHIEPNFDSWVFTGQVSIDVAIVESTATILLNAAQLQFQSARLTLADGREFPATEISLDETVETVKFQFAQSIPAGTRGTLHIAYTGLHNEKMAGFYRSQYQEVTSREKKYLVVTQFEPTDARKALPCWDEPAIKATFDVSLTVLANQTALSNMNDIETVAVAGGAKKRVRFATSPIMSTYLLAFVVGDLEMMEMRSDDVGKTLVRVFAPRGQVHQGKFALETAAKILKVCARRIWSMTVFHAVVLC